MNESKMIYGHFKKAATLCCALFCFWGSAVFLWADDADNAMRDTIHYGTDGEIAILIKKIKADKISGLDEDLAELAEKSNNETILSGIFSYFSEQNKKGLEDKALAILQDREDKSAVIILAAIDYEGAIQDKNAQTALLQIVSQNEERYNNAAIKALGKIAGGAGQDAADEMAEYLIKFYLDSLPTEDTRHEIIISLGSTGSQKALPFLTDLMTDNDVNAYLKTASLEALGKIKDPSSLDIIIEAASHQDASVRAAAISALGNFDDKKSSQTILDAFRDSFFRARLAAAKAAGTRKISDAIPYLRYRALNDDAASVREESIKALGAMDSQDANQTLATIFEDQKINDRIRILCAEALLKNDTSAYCDVIIAKLDDLKKTRQTNLYNGLLKALIETKTPKLQELAARLFSSKDVTDNAFALEITARNNFSAFKDQVQKMSEAKNSSLARKAADVLEKL
jgi:HEAT repeat protein